MTAPPSAPTSSSRGVAASTVPGQSSVPPRVDPHLLINGVLPITVVALYLVVVGVRSPGVLAGILVVAVALVAISRWMIRKRSSDTDRRDQAFEVVAGLIGPPAVAAAAIWVVDAPVAPLGLLIGGQVVAVAYLLDDLERLLVQVSGLVVWVGALVITQAAVTTVVGHAAGGVALLLVVNRAADQQQRRRAQEVESRTHAEALARLLASVQQVNSLQPCAVLEAVVAGLRDVGVGSAEIRRIDRDAGVARLEVGWCRRDVVLEPELPLDLPLQQELQMTDQPVIVEDARTDPRVRRGHIGYRSLLLLPLPIGGGRGVLSVSSFDGPLTRLQDQAARLLATNAAQALQRAGVLETDRRIVQDLQRLDVRTQDFISTASHELRTPLTVIAGLVQTLQERWDDLGPERREDLLQRIDANAERLSTIVRSLLDTSAFDRGELRPSLEPLRLRPAVVRLLDRLATVTAAHPVTVDVSADVEVLVDPALLEHVLENLLANVAKHTPQGTEVAISAELDGERVDVRVRDRGPGIPDEELPHVLDRFFRGGDPNRRPSGGLGLGLALAQQIARAHGGELEVESAVGEGTTFRFSLPSAAPAR